MTLGTQWFSTSGRFRARGRAHSRAHSEADTWFHLENGRFCMVCGALEDTTIDGEYRMMHEWIIFKGLIRFDSPRFRVQRWELRVKRIRQAVLSFHLILLRPGTGALPGALRSRYLVAVGQYLPSVTFLRIYNTTNKTSCQGLSRIGNVLIDKASR